MAVLVVAWLVTVLPAALCLSLDAGKLSIAYCVAVVVFLLFFVVVVVVFLTYLSVCCISYM